MRVMRSQPRTPGLEAVSRSHARSLILGRPTALEKVSAFLVEIAKCSLDNVADAFVLPLSCRDIAECLGLAVERVGRALAGLKDSDAIGIVGTVPGDNWSIAAILQEPSPDRDGNQISTLSPAACARRRETPA
jgi:hypothetical protein